MRGKNNREGDELFGPAKGADLEERFRVMEELGRAVEDQHMASSSHWSGIRSGPARLM